MKGFINIIKPEGMSSAHAVNSVKRKFNCPCGHMGTLDPMASGVLPVGIGKTSRLFQYLMNKKKTYVARFRFGYTTDTLDTTGLTTDTTSVVPDINLINSVLPRFIGDIEQIPPKYSAKCVDGKRGYQLARRGVEFELPPKTVSVLGIECLGQTEENEFEFKIDCRGGTYIRSLARDIGVSCGSLGVMSALSRTACGIFDYANGVALDEFISADNAEKFIIPADDAVDFEKLHLRAEQAQKILDGVYENYGVKDGVYRVYNVDEFWGIGKAKDGTVRIEAYVR